MNDFLRAAAKAFLWMNVIIFSLAIERMFDSFEIESVTFVPFAFLFGALLILFVMKR